MRKSLLSQEFEYGRHVKLNRYLAGVPFSHDRNLTVSERREILARVLPPIFLAALVLFLVYLNYGFYHYSNAFALAVGFECLWFLAYLSRVYPYLVALKEDCVHVYFGKLDRIGTGKTVQQHFLSGYPEYSQEIGRSVEVLSVGNSQRLWKVQGYRARRELTSVVPTFLSTLPDVDESIHRPLTTPEILELRSRLRHEHGTYVSLPLLIYIGCILPQLGKPPINEGMLFFDVVATICLVLYTAVRLRDAWPVIRSLNCALRDGTVRDGYLGSGLPWVIRGEPAKWRTLSLAPSQSLSAVFAQVSPPAPSSSSIPSEVKPLQKAVDVGGGRSYVGDEDMREDPRHEIRRYLAGVPFSHERMLTKLESRQIWSKVSRLLTRALVVTCSLIAFAIYLSSEPVLALLGALLSVVPIALVLFWCFPYIYSLLNRKVAVYIGVLPRLAEGEIVQNHFLQFYPEFDAELGRVVEILAVGRGHRLWKLEGKETLFDLSEAIPSQHLTVPDAHPHETRRLHAFEKWELIRYLLQELSPLGEALGFILLILVVNRGVLKDIPVVTAQFAVVVLYIGFRRNWIKSSRIARSIFLSLRAGVVKDGCLASGWEWTKDGRPCVWRLSSLPYGSGISKLIP